MRAFVFPRVARAAWLVLLLAPALALAAPKGKPPAKKTPAKKAPAGKTDEGPEPAATTPDAEPGSAGGSSGGARTPPAAGAGAGGSAGTAGADKAGGGSGAGTGADKPADSTAEPATDKPSEGPDVDTLRQEYLSLRDELFRSRARANAVASQLYSTRIQIRLTYASGRDYSPIKSSIRLDGAAVYEDSKGSIAGDDGIRFDGYVAPGRHLVTFRIEATGKDDDTFTSVTENQIVVKAVSGKDLLVAAKARDSGDIAYKWKKSESGSYGLAVDVAIKTGAHEDKK